MTGVHPAQFSKSLMEAIEGLLVPTLAVHDPFAGTGDRLGELCDKIGCDFSGTEIEPEFILDPRVVEGDSTDPDTYPDWPHMICCMAHGERILTADLRWVDVATIGRGDRLLAFDEHARHRRKYKFATVTEAFPATKRCVEVTLASGQRVVTTQDHPWLWRPYAYQGTAWKSAARLLEGFDSHVAFVLPEWDRASSFEAGWLSGMFDGEGWLGFGERHQQLAIAQAPGALQDRIEQLLADTVNAKINVWESVRDGKRSSMQTYVQGGLSEVFRVLGTLRPERLISDLQHKSWTGTMQPEWQRVVSVRDVGERTVQSITTDSATYIAAGFAMHNTSPVYPNGMADDFNAKDGSKRRTYRSALAKKLGRDRPLHPNNQGRWGYRGTPAWSDRRAVYWKIANDVVACWAEAGAAIVNVSDFLVGDRREPVVAQWRKLLEAHGWEVSEMPVETPRFTHGANRERVEAEVLLLCSKDPAPGMYDDDDETDYDDERYDNEIDDS